MLENWEHLMFLRKEYFCKRSIFPQIVHPLHQVICVNGRIS